MTYEFTVNDDPKATLTNPDRMDILNHIHGLGFTYQRDMFDIHMYAHSDGRTGFLRAVFSGTYY